MTWLEHDLGQGVTVGMVLVVALIALVFGLGAWRRGRHAAQLRNRPRPCPLCGKPTRIRPAHDGTYAQWVCDGHGAVPMAVFEGDPPADPEQP
jgi:hypothetical protein